LKNLNRLSDETRLLIAEQARMLRYQFNKPSQTY